MKPLELLPAEIRAQLPPLYSQEKNPDPIAYVKFFTPDFDWTWYGTEFDGEDLFFGLVQAQEEELGYFSLQELRGFRGPMGLPIERDLWFKPTPLSRLREEGNPEISENAEQEDPAHFVYLISQVFENN
ncbi:Protein of unknown function (DUF2958) [Cylindrospermum stagnale PCC 7417]|uniref:DUF2958 domain-containing protein n=1 Tax=Cylindrospermum stagnale PCC 7417 TaxID=56107 RepID=K9X484_9NOST|nr:DUF2958 domain-containing protein [Cylindrospermum stagnale]AFZ27273.1 Protein of unknown function (DUF2958) [Cylindrospermum stagnale PCC 7417]